MNLCKHGIPTFAFCVECCRELTNISKLSKTSTMVMAAHAMVSAHKNSYTLKPALHIVSEEFPDIPEPLLVALWMGVNAKELDSEVFSSHQN